MATLRNLRKLAAVSRETPENTRNSQSENTLDPETAQEYISQVSEEIEGRVSKKLSKEFNRTESRILGALFKLDEWLLNPQVRTCSVAVPGTSRNSDWENGEPTGDRSLNDPCPEAVFSSHHSANPNGSEQEETHHSCFAGDCVLSKKREFWKLVVFSDDRTSLRNEARKLLQKVAVRKETILTNPEKLPKVNLEVFLKAQTPSHSEHRRVCFI